MSETNIKLMKKVEVMETVKMSQSNIYRLMAMDKFPKPVKVGTGAVRWVASEIQDFLSEKMAARD